MTLQKNTERKERSDKGHVQLNDRDFWALQWIAEQYAVRLDQVQNLLGRKAGRGANSEDGISENAARLVVNRWKRAKLVEYKKITVEDPGWVWLTANGLHAFELPYKFYEPSLAKLTHLFAVNEVRLQIEDERSDGTWKSERELRTGLTYNKGDTLAHLPDAHYIIGTETIGIEVELTPKKPADLQMIVRELAETYYQTWYFVADAARNGVVGARNRLEDHLAKRIFVCDYPNNDESNEEEDSNG